MSSPISDPIAVWGKPIVCDKCKRNIYHGGVKYKVKNKRILKKGIFIVCHCCAEGVIKDYEEMKAR